VVGKGACAIKRVIHPPDPLALAGTISHGSEQENDGVGRAGTGARTRFSPPVYAGRPDFRPLINKTNSYYFNLLN